MFGKNKNERLELIESQLTAAGIDPAQLSEESTVETALASLTETAVLTALQSVFGETCKNAEEGKAALAAVTGERDTASTALDALAASVTAAGIDPKAEKPIAEQVSEKITYKAGELLAKVGHPAQEAGDTSEEPANADKEPATKEEFLEVHSQLSGVEKTTYFRKWSATFK